MMPDWLQFFQLARFGRPLLLFVVLYAGLWIVARGFRLRLNADSNFASAARVLVYVISAAALAAFTLIAIWYATDKRYYDFAEPTMPAVAWMFEGGKPLYPPPDAPEQYAHIYGPMAFIPLASAMRFFGTDLSVTKWIGAGAGILALVVLSATLTSRVGSRFALTFTGACALLLLIFRNAAFWSRPDSLELFCVSIGLWTATRRGRVSWLLLGISAGILWNLKFSGPLYSLPLFLLFFERTDRRHVIFAIATAAMVALLPFVTSRNISFHDYCTWILLSGRNGIVWSTLRQNFEWVGYLAAPLAVAGTRHIRSEAATTLSRRVAISIGFAMCAVAVLASKPGGGPYHLIPFLPLIAFLTAIQIHRQRFDDVRSDRLLASVAFAGVAVLLALAQQTSFISTVRQIDAIGPIADVTRFSNQHTDGVIQMGYSSDERMTFVRPLVVFRSGMYLLDQPAIQEHQLAGVEIPPATENALRSCSVTYWLIPKTGQPFSAINRYPMTHGRELFGSDFRRAFLDSYQRSASTEYFDVWTCRRETERR